MADSSFEIDRSRLQKLLERGAAVTVLDVRHSDEWAEWSIPGSLNVDAYEGLNSGDSKALEGIDLPKDRVVVTVCGAGVSSLKAVEQLREQGYDQAFSLQGGMKAWSLAWNTAEVDLPAGETKILQVRRTGKGCLSYLIGSNGHAAVIDAAVEPEVYMKLAAERGWRITHILDTHIHADHLSRGRALADLSGAAYYLPAQERASYRFNPLIEGDELRVGDAKVAVLHTPGHTFESCCYLVDDQALATGDTLFLDSVGRPDLEANSAEARERANQLFESIHHLLNLSNETIVLPGHTSKPVPFDGEALAAQLYEVRERAGLLSLEKEAFVDAILGRVPPSPPNHQRIVALNQAGVLPEEGLADLEAGANRCAIR